jgi:hypothetical protein
MARSRTLVQIPQPHPSPSAPPSPILGEGSQCSPFCHIKPTDKSKFANFILKNLQCRGICAIIDAYFSMAKGKVVL